VSENCNAKEGILAVQEAMERLTSSIGVNEDDEDEEDSKSAAKILPPAAQLDRMVSTYAHSKLVNSCEFPYYLYIVAIPRLAPSSSHPFDTIRRLSRDLDHAIKAIAPFASASHSRALVVSVSALVQTIITWIRARDSDEAKISECSVGTVNHRTLNVKTPYSEPRMCCSLCLTLL
jgi:hypothetical protein